MIHNINIETDIYIVEVIYNDETGLLNFSVQTKNEFSIKYLEKLNIEDIPLPFPDFQKYDMIHRCLINTDDDRFYVEYVLENNILNINFNVVLNEIYCTGFTVSLHKEYEIIQVNENSMLEKEIKEIDSKEEWNRMDFLELKYICIEKNIEKLFELIEKQNDAIVALENKLKNSNSDNKLFI